VENIGKTLEGRGIDTSSLNRTPIAQEKRARIQMGFVFLVFVFLV
jgi:hypothetical protein